MSQPEILQKLKELSVEERIAFIEDAVSLIKQDLQRQKAATPRPPLRVKVGEWKNWPADATFSREEIYEDAEG